MNSQELSRKKKFAEVIQFDENKVLGEGAFSKVFQVSLKADPYKHFAMKKINLDNISKENAIFLLKEMQLHKKLRHPNIVQFKGSFQEETTLYYLFELAENGSLFYYIDAKEGLPAELALRFAFEAALAIRYLHKHGIAHRDIKPENVLFDANFQLKLCDFGWSCSLEKGKARNTICGTYEYMSPEIAYNIDHDHKVDVWSLGVLLYEMLHGAPPFKASTMEEIKQELLDQNIVLNGDLQPEVLELIKMLLRVDASERPDIEEVLELPIFKDNISKFQKPLNQDQLALLATNFMFNSNFGKDKILPKVVEDFYFSPQTLDVSSYQDSESSQGNSNKFLNQNVIKKSEVTKPLLKQVYRSENKNQKNDDYKRVSNLDKQNNPLLQVSNNDFNQKNSSKKSNDTEKIVLGSQKNNSQIYISQNKSSDFDNNLEKKNNNDQFKNFKVKVIKLDGQEKTQSFGFSKYKSTLKKKPPVYTSQTQINNTSLAKNNNVKNYNTQQNDLQLSKIQYTNQLNKTQNINIQTQQSSIFSKNKISNNFSTGQLISNTSSNKEFYVNDRKIIFAKNQNLIKNQQLDKKIDNIFTRQEPFQINSQQGFKKYQSLVNLNHLYSNQNVQDSPLLVSRRTLTISQQRLPFNNQDEGQKEDPYLIDPLKERNKYERGTLVTTVRYGRNSGDFASRSGSRRNSYGRNSFVTKVFY